MKSLLLITVLLFSGFIFANAGTEYSNKVKDVKEKVVKAKEQLTKEDLKNVKEKVNKKVNNAKQIGKNKVDAESESTEL